MNPLTQARTIVAEALAGIGVPVQPVQPGAATLPAVTLQPGGYWLDRRGRVAIDIVARVNAAAGPDALAQLEDIVWAVRTALAADGRIAWDDVDAPDFVNDGTAYAATIPVSLRLPATT